MAKVSCKKLTAEQVEAIRSTWKIVDEDVLLHGLSLFQNIFKIAPAAYGLFSFLKDVPMDEMTESPGLQVHANRVMGTVGAAVQHAEDLSALHCTLYSLGTKHSGLGIKAEHYPIVGQALLQTLSDAFGDTFTHDIREAWATLYSGVSCMMQNSPEEVTWL